MSNKLLEDKEIVKLEKKLGSVYADEIRSSTPEDLDNKLILLAKYRQEIVDAKAADVELQRAKDLVKELSAPYRESLKGNELRTRFICKVLEEKGK